jgi:hypothetical protein
LIPHASWTGASYGCASSACRFSKQRHHTG